MTKKKAKFILWTFLLWLLIPCLFIGQHYINSVYSELGKFSKEKLTYSSSLILLKSNKLEKDDKIGIIKYPDDIEGNILGKKLIKKEKLTNELIEYDGYLDMLNDLYTKKIKAIITSSNYNLLFNNEEGYENISDEVYSLFSYSEVMANKDNITNNKKLTEPFTVLILGVDSTTDKLNPNQAFNGDTLMLLTFNPQTLNATMFSIPRDTYVPIACREGAYAKINSSAASGTSCVIKTIKNLIDIDIDYYVKINFKGVVDLVDALGSIEINIGKDFCEQNSNREFGDKLICLKKGKQKVNGEEALAFARHRHTLPRGDLDRIQNQQQIVEQVAKSVKNIRSLEGFEKILKTISKNIDTNISPNQILSFYSVAKNMVFNDNSFINIEKSYLETFNLPVYLPKSNSYTSAQGYYANSLEDIKKAMKVNLNLEKPSLIKTFDFSYNDNYEVKILGKGIYSGDKLRLMPSLIGEKIEDVKTWCQANNISLTIEASGFASHGIVTSQSIHQGTLLLNKVSLTVTVTN